MTILIWALGGLAAFLLLVVTVLAGRSSAIKAEGVRHQRIANQTRAELLHLRNSDARLIDGLLERADRRIAEIENYYRRSMGQ